MLYHHLHGDPVDGWLNFPVLVVSVHRPDWSHPDRCRFSARRYRSSDLSADRRCRLSFLLPVIVLDSDRPLNPGSAWALRYFHQSSAVQMADRHLEFVACFSGRSGRCCSAPASDPASGDPEPIVPEPAAR